MIRLGLLRHGHTEWNRLGRIQGRSDIPLDPEARAQLSALRLPDGWAQADLWSSPMIRAKESALLLTGRNPRVDAALTEMDWGAFEGKRGIDLADMPDSGFRHIEDWGWHWRPPGGESPADLRDRLLPWAMALETDSIAVCHIGIMRVLMAVAHDWNFAGPAPFQIKRNRLFVVTISDGRLSPDGPPVRLVGM